MWICVHAYVVAYWIKVLILMCIDRIVNGSSYNNLIEVIIIALLKGGGLTMEKLVKKLLCFGVVGSIHFMVKKHESQNKSRILGHHFRWVFIVLPIRQTWRFNPWRIWPSLGGLKASWWTCMVILAIVQKGIWNFKN